MGKWSRKYNLDGLQRGPAGAASWSKDGQPFQGVPQLKRNDDIQLIVTWASGPPPASLSAYVIISANQQAGNPATDVSPFGSVDHPTVFASQKANVNKNTYVFDKLGLSGTRAPGAGTRQYEMTIAFVDGDNQWEEDPEFDTSGG